MNSKWLRVAVAAAIALMGMYCMSILTETSEEPGFFTKLASAVLNAPSITELFHEPSAWLRIGYLAACYSLAEPLTSNLSHGGYRDVWPAGFFKDASQFRMITSPQSRNSGEAQ